MRKSTASTRLLLGCKILSKRGLNAWAKMLQPPEVNGFFADIALDELKEQKKDMEREIVLLKDEIEYNGENKLTTCLPLKDYSKRSKRNWRG